MWFKKTFGRQDHIKTNTGLCKGEIINIGYLLRVNFTSCVPFNTLLNIIQKCINYKIKNHHASNFNDVLIKLTRKSR